MKKHDRENRHHVDEDSNTAKLSGFHEDSEGTFLTTNQGVRVSQTDDSLKAGGRGPTLMEDFHFREKLTHFDHERIPERVVHARGSAAHGHFQVYESLAELTRARFLQDPSVKTPVFVRFSTVVGSRGSADTVRDVRGFAVKFYTQDGNYDLVGNNMPVFFIQDAIKFPDLVHAIKPEPHNEMPQASAAHNTFWDFISLMPETMHMIVWVLSDRAIPRSFAMMEGFGVHTFRFINQQGRARFVKFHWKPLKGVHSLVWDEAQKLAGKDPDWLRRDLWDSIARGDYPEFELGVQVVEEEDEFKFDFDLLDATKLIPEELVPVRAIGRMVLNRNPDNFFAETEQVAFHPGHVVDGIDFTNDPLLQGRLFSYLDTQLIRLGGPNFAELPINRPVVPVHNNQRDGYARQAINKGPSSYSPNSLGGGYPKTAPRDMGGYVHHAERVDGQKIRQRSESFGDHFTQARLFWNSQSEVEKKHLVEAGRFELGKVDRMEVRERMVALLANIDTELAAKVAEGIGVASAVAQRPKEGRKREDGKLSVDVSPALSTANTPKEGIKGRRVAILAADGVDVESLMQVKAALEKEGAQTEVVSRHQGELTTGGSDRVKVDQSYLTTGSIMYDAVYVPGGKASLEKLKTHGDAVHFINEAFRHCKTIGAVAEGVELLGEARLEDIDLSDEARGKAPVLVTKGVVTAPGNRSLGAFTGAFVKAIAQHRHWAREGATDRVPA